MSMKFLFNRSSPVVHVLEISGASLSLLYFWKSGLVLDWNFGLFGFLFVSYLFVRSCDLALWYARDRLPRDDPRAIGIRVHFQKALVPTSYILAVSSLMALWDVPVLTFAILILADLMMMVIAPVNGILIYFHLRDKDPLPTNYFSANHYKNDGTKTSRDEIQELQASTV